MQIISVIKGYCLGTKATMLYRGGILSALLPIKENLKASFHLRSTSKRKNTLMMIFEPVFLEVSAQTYQAILVNPGFRGLLPGYFSHGCSFGTSLSLRRLNIVALAPEYQYKHARHDDCLLF